MAAWTQRQIDAPDEPFLIEEEVRHLLRIRSETTLDKLIESGQLPRPLKRGGKNCWAWKDVVYANLAMELADRLAPLTPGLQTDPEEAEEWAPQKTPRLPQKGPKSPQNNPSSP